MITISLNRYSLPLPTLYALALRTVQSNYNRVHCDITTRYHACKRGVGHLLEISLRPLVKFEI